MAKMFEGKLKEMADLGLEELRAMNESRPVEVPKEEPVQAPATPATKSYDQELSEAATRPQPSRGRSIER